MTEIETEASALSAEQIRPPPVPPYDAAFFADKHGLTLKAAEVILFANGPSRNMCDAAANAFLRAVTERRDRRLSLALD